MNERVIESVSLVGQRNRDVCLGPRGWIHTARCNLGSDRKSGSGQQGKQDVLAAIDFVHRWNPDSTIWHVFGENNLPGIFVQRVELRFVIHKDDEPRGQDYEAALGEYVASQLVTRTGLRKISVWSLPHDLSSVQIVSSDRAPRRSDDVTLVAIASLIARWRWGNICRIIRLYSFRQDIARDTGTGRRRSRIRQKGDQIVHCVSSDRGYWWHPTSPFADDGTHRVRP